MTLIAVFVAWPIGSVLLGLALGRIAGGAKRRPRPFTRRDFAPAA